MTEYLRLAGATLVVLAPGLVLARAVGRGGAAGALVCALAAIFAGLVVVFAAGSSLALALWLLPAVGLIPLPLALRRGFQRPDTGWLLVLLAGIVFGWLLWLVLPEPAGDALFHLARVRKLVELDSLSLEGVGEFRDGGLHPGYAFPLWHGFLALVAKVSGLDPAVVVEREAAVLAPLSFLVVYEAGTALFRSAWLGAATLAGTVALTGLSSGAGGAFRLLVLPATAGGRQLLFPAVLALVFAYLRAPARTGLALVALASLVLAVVHPTYALFTLLLVAGFLAARALLGPEDLVPLGKAAAVMAVAAAAFLLWLFPTVRTAASFTPTNAQLTGRQHGIGRYPRQFDVWSPNRYRLAPEVVSRAGPVPVAGLALVPLALLAARRRWAAFVLGATLAALAVLLIPFVFPRFVDAVSLSQARRLAAFLPVTFALAGGAAVLARLLSYAVLPLAVVAGILARRWFPGDFGYVLEQGGPALVVWIAAFGGLAALLVGAVTRLRLPPLARADWLPAAACALFVLPIAVQTSWERPVRVTELTPGLVQAVRRDIPEGAVVLADPETSYWLSAYAPVYVAVSAPAHVGDTEKNRPYERVAEWKRFVRTGAFPGRYEWIVVDARRADVTCSPKLYADARYTLCARTQSR